MPFKQVNKVVKNDKIIGEDDDTEIVDESPNDCRYEVEK